MPPTLSPASRLRSRTSDISDLLRGRHDAKTSTESQQPPPVPTHPTAEPVTPTSKSRGKFSFLGRMRKPSSVSPSSARVASDAAAGRRGQDRDGTVPPLPGVDAKGPGQLPAGATASSSSHKASPASLPPLNVSPPSLGFPPVEGSASKIASPASPQSNQRIPSGIPTATLRNLRPQKSTSFENSRSSNDSHGRIQSSGSSSRPIITISPPHNTAESAGTFHAPRSAPRPPGQPSSREPSQSGIPNPAATSSDRVGLSSPTSDVTSPATSVRSSTQFPIPSVDGPLATTSYKEESILRKDHFEIGISEPQASQRRGTVSGTHQITGGSVGRSTNHDHAQRRHISVLHLNKLKQEVSSSAFPRVRRSGAHSDSTSTSGQSGNESTASSRSTISPISRTKSASSPGARKVPPSLPRTWHTPPSTGPPTEPLPSPPASATLQPLILASTSRSSALPVPSPPPSPNKTLPPVPPKDSPVRSQRAQSSQLLDDVPPSPARSQHDASPAPASVITATPDSKPNANQPLTRPPAREDAVKKILADENATAEELREALRTQSAKYARLMSYLLTLTERHGMEKHEFIRRIEALEQDARRRERELKGLRWLVANSSQSQLQLQLQKRTESEARAQGRIESGKKGETLAGPARADSGTFPRSEVRTRQRSCSESVLSSSLASPSVLKSRTGTASSHETVGKRSADSPTGSTEEGLFELQTTIAEFIAPQGSSPPMVEEQQQRPSEAKPSSLSPSASLKRSNTLPDSLSQLPAASSKQKQARRTSSPVLPVSNAGSPAKTTSPASFSGGLRKAGLGIGIDLPVAQRPDPSSPGLERKDERDLHARSDSSTLSSLPSLSTLHTASSGLSSIPETPRTDAEFPLSVISTPSSPKDSAHQKKSEESRTSRTFRRLSTSSLSSSTSSTSGSASYATSSRVSASPSIGQVLDRSSRQPEMDAILRKLRAFGHHGSP